MKPRTIFITVGVVALIGVALGVGTALGSRNSHAQQPVLPLPDPATKAATQSKTASGIKPKSQAYAYFMTDGTLKGPSKKVITVGHPQVGLYCVQLASSLHVDDNTIALTSIDYYWSFGSNLVSRSYSYSAYCAGYGYPNSVTVLTFNASSALPQDGAVYFTIP